MLDRVERLEPEVEIEGPRPAWWPRRLLPSPFCARTEGASEGVELELLDVAASVSNLTVRVSRVRGRARLLVEEVLAEARFGEDRGRQ